MTLVGQIAFTMPFLWVLLQGSPWAFAASAGDAGRHRHRGELCPGQARPAHSARQPSPSWSLILFPGFALLDHDVHDGRPGLRGGDALPGGRRVSRWAVRRPANHRAGAGSPPRWSSAAGHSASGSSPSQAPVAVLIAAMASDPYRAAPALSLRPGRRPGRRARRSISSRTTFPGQPAIHLSPFPPGAVAHVVAGVTTLALMLAPALVLAAATWIPIWRRARRTTPGRRTRPPRDRRRGRRVGGGGRPRVPVRQRRRRVPDRLHCG